MKRVLFASWALLAACGAPSSPAASPSNAPPSPKSAPPAEVARPAPTDDDTVAALQRAALASARGEALARSLATSVGARPAGGAKFPDAVRWALDAMNEIGLRNVHTEKVMVPHWERGATSVEVVTPKGPKKLAALALGGSPGTPAAGLEAEVVTASSMDALDALDAKAVKGKIVFLDVATRRARDGGGYGESVGARFRGPKRAEEKGAVAVVLRSIATDPALPHTGATARGAKIPSVALSGESADALRDALAASKRTRVRIALGASWQPDVEAANVVGEIVGAREPQEIVLLGAHLDSWDVGQGAIDDGAGCAIVLDAARLVAAAGRAPKRTVRVVLFAAEEMGLSGGKAYAKDHEAEAARHVVALEADSGTAKVYAARFLGAPDARASFEGIARLEAPLAIAVDEKDASGGADIHPLLALGVPVVDLEQDFSAYFDVHHTDGDTVERLDPDGIRQSAAAYATFAWKAAQMDGDFGRVPSEKRESKW